jgi:hypothetical protein
MVEFNSEQMFLLAVFGLILLGMMWNELMKMLTAWGGSEVKENKPLIHIEMSGSEKKVR